jgi:hypothetical protein
MLLFQKTTKNKEFWIAGLPLYDNLAIAEFVRY